MKEKLMRQFMVLTVLTGLLLVWGNAQADFYVIAAGKSAKKVILVSPKATPALSGAALLSAIGKITDASATNTYLIYIEPGVYNVGSTSFVMKEYVDVEGSGQKATKITGAIHGEQAGVVKGAPNAELRSLTIENTGGVVDSTALFNSASHLLISDVTAVAAGGSNSNIGIMNVLCAGLMIKNTTATATGGTNAYGIATGLSGDVTLFNVKSSATSGSGNNIGIKNDLATPVYIRDTVASATGGTNSYGIGNNFGAVTLYDSSASGSGASVYNIGVHNANSNPVRIHHSTLSGTTNSVSSESNSKVYLGATYLNGCTRSSGGTIDCVGVYQQYPDDWQFHPDYCPSCIY